MRKFESYTLNYRLLTRFRHWMVKLIAAGDVIILNAHITIIDQHTENLLVVKGVQGGCIRDNAFGADDGKILMIQQWPNRQHAQEY